MLRKRNRSIVVGIDFGPGGDKAILEAAKRVAEGWATELHAVHVIDPSKVGGADLIVVGSLARPRLDRLLGAVSELLVRTATCTVLVARSDEHSMLLYKTERPAPPFSAGEPLVAAGALPIARSR